MNEERGNKSAEKRTGNFPTTGFISYHYFNGLCGFEKGPIQKNRINTPVALLTWSKNCGPRGTSRCPFIGFIGKNPFIKQPYTSDGCREGTVVANEKIWNLAVFFTKSIPRVTLFFLLGDHHAPRWRGAGSKNVCFPDANLAIWEEFWFFGVSPPLIPL
jgi:hypothetical protein